MAEVIRRSSRRRIARGVRALVAAGLLSAAGAGGAAAADGRVDQRLRRPARARARRSRADPHGELARGRSRGVAVRDRGVAAHAELRHGRGAAQVRSRRRARRHLHEPVHALDAAPPRLSRPRARARELRRRHRAQRAARRGSRRPSRARRAVDRGVARRRARARSESRLRTASRRSSSGPAASPSAPTRSRTELLELAGLRNVAAEHGLDRWGSLSMEALLRSAPELIVLTGYRSTQPSLANAVLEHPALRQLGGRATLGHRAVGVVVLRTAAQPRVGRAAAASGASGERVDRRDRAAALGARRRTRRARARSRPASRC